MMKFDCFQGDFVLFGIGYEYQDVYDNLDELRVIVMGGFVKKRLKLSDFGLETDPK